MSAQLGLALGHEAAHRAAEKADRVQPGWSEVAYQAFVEYARAHDTFTTEAVRAWSVVPPPPDGRAWGQVALMAKRAGIVESAGWVRAESPTVHGMVVTLWRSAQRAAE